MSVVTNQPLPFDRLEREKHIQTIVRAFKTRCGSSCRCHVSPDWASDDQLSGQVSMRRMEEVAPQGMVTTPEVEEQRPGGAAPSHLSSMLETVHRMHIMARPELQGPQCVARRIYSITAGGSRSPLFVAVEESSCVCLQCCGPARACSLKVFDCQGHQVFYFEKPFRVDACCFGCCLMEMRTYMPQKQLIGTVCQRWSMFTPLLEVCGADGAPAVRIQGSCCPCRCFSNQEFQIVSNIGKKMGSIWKKWPGFNNDHNMDHEYFGLDVPVNMESHTKLLLLAATFLLNHMFFEMS
ncbi:phospholipid scramblase family member 5 [Antennarius striatus]|uniref:phospholipid scramblase family member 5 n=1 Tax=Antennarius striatus TaxID=241820 RepID=UPI0035AF6AEB